MTKNLNKTKKTKTKKIVLFSTLFILLFGISFSVFYYYNMFGKMETEELKQSNEDLGITSEAEKKIEEVVKDTGSITNIALFGLDQRNLKEKGRSDSIMILTIDTNSKKLKLSSIIRDSYVNIDGHGKDKINHAYAFGGPQLAVKTLNDNFNMNIKDYVTVNFFGFIKIIDALGGVTIDVKKDEIPIANDYITEMAGLENIAPNYIKNPGNQVLTGIQAVGYSRNRYSGNGDYERSDRQRRVLTALMEKIQAVGVSKYPGIISQLLPNTLTSLSSGDILKLGTDVVTSGTKNIEQERFPTDSYSEGKLINSIYYLTYKEAETKDQIFKYIFQDIKPASK
jgi:LCP family protein required for cell wall assembly